MFARVILLLAHFLAVAGEFLPGQCVTVDPISCNPDKLGTMKMDAIKNDTLLMVTDWSADSTSTDWSAPGFYTITDVKTVTYTRCPVAAVFEVDATFEDDCPKNEPGPFFGAIITVVVLSQICLGCYACCSRVQLHEDLPNVRLGVVAFTWMNKFWIAVSVSMSVQSVCWMENWIRKLILSFVMTAILILVPFFVAKMAILRCCCCCPGIRKGCYVAFIGLYGTFWAMISSTYALFPSDIAILGHHPLLLGLLNFALTIPKGVVEHFVAVFFCGEKCGEKRVYIIGFSELAHPVLWLYEDVKRDAYKALLP